jgi:hypothetical protein
MLRPIPKANPEARKALVAALTSLGYAPIGTKSKLFQAFEWTRPRDNAVFVYFVGRDGELRLSRSGRLNDSISVKGLEVYDRLLDQGHELLEQV